jgi:transcriptional regulator with XRE-family HTH domain
MPGRKRRARTRTKAERGLGIVLQREGGKVRSARLRRGWTQAELGRRVGLSQATISKIERGEGGTLSLVAWQRVANALELPLDLKLGRDAREETRDAGHLAMQELLLRFGRRSGYPRTFELTTRPSNPSAWVDVGLVDHVRRRLILAECVNVMEDIGASTRSSDRKQAEAEALAIAIGRGRPYTVHVCWVIRDTRRNRQIIGRYPELFAARFPGSSQRWVAALTHGADPPSDRGLVWCDVKVSRLFAWRQRSR